MNKIFDVEDLYTWYSFVHNILEEMILDIKDYESSDKDNPFNKIKFNLKKKLKNQIINNCLFGFYATAKNLRLYYVMMLSSSSALASVDR